MGAQGIGVTRPYGLGPGIVNQTLTRIADYMGARSAKVIPVCVPGRVLKSGGTCSACD